MRKILKNKRALELSINFLVIMILAIAVFGFGITMTTKFFGAAKQQKETIDRETEQSIQNLLATGAKVVVPINRRTIKMGDSDIFGLGILNAGGGANQNFNIVVTFNQAFKPNKERIEDADGGYINNNWILYAKSAVIPNNDHASIPILIDANNRMASGKNTIKGTYIFNVCVCRTENYPDCNLDSGCNLMAGDLYGGSMKKIYVTIP